MRKRSLTSKHAASPEVLVVDDNDDVRESLVLLLMMHGFRASGASSGFGALRRLKDGLRPALVLLDLRMPGMSGWEVWDHMRNDPAIAAIPVVVVSGEVGERQRALAAGIRRFVEKPVDPQRLLDIVAAECGG
jgi:CheY-like chemotaxis protein